MSRNVVGRDHSVVAVNGMFGRISLVALHVRR